MTPLVESRNICRNTVADTEPVVRIRPAIESPRYDREMKRVLLIRAKFYHSVLSYPNILFRTTVGYLFGFGLVLASIATWWVGGNAILVGTLTGGATLIVVGLLFMFAGVLALPLSRRRLQTRFDIDLSASTTVLLSGGAVALAVVILFVAFIALLAS